MLKIYTIFRSAIVTKYRDDSVELQNNPVFAISITTRNSEIHKATKSYLNHQVREDDMAVKITPSDDNRLKGLKKTPCEREKKKSYNNNKKGMLGHKTRKIYPSQLGLICSASTTLPCHIDLNRLSYQRNRLAAVEIRYRHRS